MVMGAGLGSRLKPFTTILPKPLVPVLGVPCIDFSLSLLRELPTVNGVVVNIHAHADQMRSHLPSEIISDESRELLGSAGGIRKALPHFNGEPFFALNADSICAVDLHALQKRHFELKARFDVVMTLALLKGEHLKRQAGSYTEIHSDPATGLMTGFGEKKQNVPFYSGIAIFEPEAFAHLTENRPAEFVPEVLKPWLQKQKVGIFEYDGLWLDVGSPALWYEAHVELLKHHQAARLPQVWSTRIQAALDQGKVSLDQPWKGWIRYGKDATPQNFLGKRGIQLDNLCYELPL